jgi:hypothetical protein
MCVSPSDEPRLSLVPRNDPQCPACQRTMRLVGRESHPEIPKAEVFTFECECGQLSVSQHSVPDDPS